MKHDEAMENDGFPYGLIGTIMGEVVGSGSSAGDGCREATWNRKRKPSGIFPWNTGGFPVTNPLNQSIDLGKL